MQAGKWYILGSPFVPLNGSETFKLTERYGGEGFADGDTLYLITSDGIYRPYFWKEIGDQKGWNRVNSSRPNFDKADYSDGIAAYIHKQSAGAVTFTGKVSATEIQFGDSENGNSWSLVALPYPAEKTLSEYEWTGCAKGDVLYYVSADGVLNRRYWNAGASDWSISSGRYVPDTTKFTVGQAVFVNKTSIGLGAVSIK